MSARPRRLTYAVVALGCVATITALGACSHSSGGSSAARAVAGSAPQLNPVVNKADRTVVPSPAAVGSAGGTVGHGVATGTYAAVLETGAKIRTAQISVQVRHGRTVAAQADQAEAIALGAGGEIDTDDRTSGRYAVANLVLRVPPEQLSAVLTQLSRLGIERSRHVTTQDVTSRVADVNSRVASAKQEIARLRVLYGQARRISDIISIESQLSSRESDLEALQAQQRALAAETSRATITLALTSPSPVVTKPAPPKKTTHAHGFVAGLKAGWHAFTTGLTSVATAVGAVLPFAVLLAVLAMIARVLWPRVRPVRPVRAPAPDQ